MLDQSAGPALAAAAEQGIFVIVKEALANGRLTSRSTNSKAPQASVLSRPISYAFYAMRVPEIDG